MGGHIVRRPAVSFEGPSRWSPRAQDHAQPRHAPDPGGMRHQPEAPTCPCRPTRRPDRRGAIRWRCQATWTPPPGNALEHHTAGFAKTLCSAVFITGLDPGRRRRQRRVLHRPAWNTGARWWTPWSTGPDQEVRLTLKSGVTRVARRFGSQGCIALPIGQDSVFFTPSVVKPNLPRAATTPWPMGDMWSPSPWPAGIDSVDVRRRRWRPGSARRRR